MKLNRLRFLFAACAAALLCACTQELDGDTTYALPAGTTACVVTFNTDGGGSIARQVVESGKTASEPDAPSKAGHRFDGWYTDADLKNAFSFETPVRQNLTLYAKWTAAFTVTFDTNGGSAVPDQWVEAGKKAAKPDAPTRDGKYAFGGWYADSGLMEKFDFDTKITADTTLYAKWLLPVTVTFVTNGGSEVEPQTVKSGTAATEPEEPVRSGYAFKGWCADSGLTEKFDFAAPIATNTTLHAKWAAVFTVTFAANGGSKVEPQQVEDGETATKPDTTLPGKVFEGWHTDAGLTEEFNFATPITADLTLYAKWNGFLTVEEAITYLATLTESATLHITDLKNDDPSLSDSAKQARARLLAAIDARPDGVKVGLDLTKCTELTTVKSFSSKKLKSITLPESVTSIANYAFSSSKGLESVTILGTPTIGDEAFYNCEALTSVSLTEGTPVIPSAAFQACTALKSVTIPAGVTKIGDRAFFGCSSLESITIPASVTEIGSRAFFQSGIQTITFEVTTGWKKYKYSGESNSIEVVDISTSHLYTDAQYFTGYYDSKTKSYLIMSELYCDNYLKREE